MSAMRAALALGSGFTLALALPPWGWWPLAIIGVAGLELAIGAGAGLRRRLLLGWVFGIGWMAMGLGWMWQFTAPGYLVAVVLFAGFYALATAATPPGAWRTVARPAALALAEMARFAIPFGGVPLASIAAAQVDSPLVGSVRVVGVLGLAWIVFQIGTAIGVLAEQALSRQRHRPMADTTAGSALNPTVRLAGAGMLAVVAVMAVSAIAPRGTDTGTALRIAAVQGGGEQGTSALEVPTALVTERHLLATQSIGADEVDLVLWPENTIRIRRQPFELSEIAGMLRIETDRLGAPIAVGITEDADLTGLGDPGQVTNAQVMLAPDGTVTSRYDKVRRVPFGEYVPLRGTLEALGLPVEQVRTDAVPGQEPAIITMPDGTPLGVSISWEVFFPDRARDAISSGGAVLLNPTNGASYTGTIVQTQQIASSRLRAIESGRWVVQAAPTGFSAFINPDGRIIQRTNISERAVIIDEVMLRSGTTWYARLGDLPLILVWISMIAVAWFATRRRLTDR